MAATGAEIAQAYVAVTVRAPGIQKDLEKQLGGAGLGQRVGSRIMSGLTKAVKVGAVAAGAAVATIGVAGFKAATGIEQSQKVLGGLYGDAKLATKTMNDLRDATKTSPIDSASYDKAAQSLAYAGIQGKDAVGTLKNVGLAITAAGGGTEKLDQAMGGLLAGINNGGIFMMDSLNRISDSGVPILSGLAEHFGVGIDKVREMASAGEVGLNDVMTVMQDGVGGTFEQMIAAGTEAEGSLSNTWKSVKDSVIDAVGMNMLPLVESITPVLQTAGSAVTDFIKGMGSGEGAGGQFVSFLREVWERVKDAGSAFSDVGGAFGELFGSARDLLKEFLPELEKVRGFLGDAALGSIRFFAETLSSALRMAADFVRALIPWKDALVSAGVGIGAIVLGMKAWTLAKAAWTTATKIATAAQTLFNKALKANPIGVIITAVSGLVAALVYFFTQTETGKKVWASIMEAFRVGWEQLKGIFETVIDAFAAGWQQIKDGFDWLIGAFALGWEQIKAGFQWVIDAFALGWQQIQSGFQWVIDAFGLGWEQIKTGLTAVKDFFVGIWTSITDWIGQKIAQAKLIITVGVWAIRQMWNNVWSTIRNFFVTIWTNIVSWVTTKINQVKMIIEVVSAGIRYAWSTVWNGIKNFFVNLWNTIVNWVTARIDAMRSVISIGVNAVRQVWTSVWNTIKSVFSNVWNNIKSTLTTMIDFVKTKPAEAFRKAKDGIVSAWNKIKAAAKTPVEFVLQKVINEGLIGTINKIPGVNIATLSLPKGFRIGGYTGNAGINEIAGVVHGREHVTRAESTAKLNRSHPGLLDHMNRYGTLPGYRKGGYVSPLPAGSYNVSQPFHSGHNGIDLAAPTGTKTMAAAAGRILHAGWEPAGSFGGGNQVNVLHPGNIVTWYAHLSSIAARVGKQVRKGETIGRVGSTGNSTGPHLHYMVETGYKGSLGSGNWINPAPYMTGHTAPTGGDGGWWNPLDGIVKWVTDKIKDKFPGGGMFIDAAAGLAKDTAEKAVKHFTSFIGKDDTGSAFAPMLYDGGGLLPPGLTLTNNKTGRPERVLTDPQWNDIVSNRAGRSSGPVTVFIGDREFEGWMDDRADGRIDAANEDAERTSRLVRAGGV